MEKGTREMNIPYNNGKVEIGKYYQKDSRPYMDADAILLQTALIDCDAYRKRYLSEVMYVFLVVMTLFGYFLFS